MGLWERFLTGPPQRSDSLTTTSLWLICFRLQWSHNSSAVRTTIHLHTYISTPSVDEMSGEMWCQWQWVLVRVLLCNVTSCEWCNAPTCTRSLILNQQVLLILTSGLLQLTLVAVVFAIWATNLQNRTSWILHNIRFNPQFTDILLMWKLIWVHGNSILLKSKYL